MTMTDRSSSAFMMSALLHGGVIAVVVFFTLATNRAIKENSTPFHLVDGEGNNFNATMAPADGGGGRSAPTPRTMAQTIRHNLIVADSKAKNAVRKEREAEQKLIAQQEAEERAREKLQPQTTPTPSAKKDPAKFTKIDTASLVKGVAGGSKTVTEGAGGDALVRSDGTAQQAYFAMLKERLLRAVDKPSGVSDTLTAEVEFRLNADGTLSGVRIVKRSGSPEFDRAVLDAFERVQMPPRPDGRGDVHQLAFLTKDAQEH
jgi:colicin import membrane protein